MLSFTFHVDHVDVHEHLIVSIRVSIEEVFHVQTPAVTKPLLGYCSSKALSGIAPHSNCHISKLTPPIEVFLSILEPSWLLVSVGGGRSQRLGPSPILGSLGPSHQQRHQSRVSLQGLPCAHGVSELPYGGVRNMGLQQKNLIINLYGNLFRQKLLHPW